MYYLGESFAVLPGGKSAELDPNPKLYIKGESWVS
jgi:hypothetical protein